MALSWWEKIYGKFACIIATVHAKVEYPKCPPDVRSRWGPFHNLWSWTEKWKIYTDIFYGVSCNIKCITPISNLHLQYKNRKLTFSNGPQLMGKRFMANLHASLDSTCKNRTSKMSMRYHISGGVHIFHNLWSWTEKWKIYTDIFYGVSCNIKYITPISNL